MLHIFSEISNVKKIILVLAALTAVAYSAKAQQDSESTSSRARIAIGISGHVYPTMAIVSRLAGPGIDFDCFWDRVIGPIDFGIGAQANYMVSLPDEDGNAGISGVDILVPVRLRYGYQFAGGPRLMVFAEASPFVGAMLRQKSSGSFSDLYTDQFKRFDLMLGGGLGIIFSDRVRINLGVDIGTLNRRISGLSIGRNYQGYIGLAFLL